MLFESLERHCRAPLRVLLPALAFDLVMPATALPEGWTRVMYHVIGILVIASASWLLVALIAVLADLLLIRYRADPNDPDRSANARRVATQVQVFRRVFLVIVSVLAACVILTTFSWGWTLGESLLASAGIAGIAVGIAAHPTLENMLAGIQLAITQPFSIEDAVIVENDWGWIEEITTTYIVVRTWDWRRLVLPLSYFIQKPFQNWTRTSPRLIGVIYFYVDYRAPIAAIRAEFNKIVEASSQWDHDVRVLQMTDATDRAIQLRALVSARMRVRRGICAAKSARSCSILSKTVIRSICRKPVLNSPISARIFRKQRLRHRIKRAHSRHSIAVAGGASLSIRLSAGEGACYLLDAVQRY